MSELSLLIGHTLDKVPRTTARGPGGGAALGGFVGTFSKAPSALRGSKEHRTQDEMGRGCATEHPAGASRGYPSTLLAPTRHVTSGGNWEGTQARRPDGSGTEPGAEPSPRGRRGGQTGVGGDVAWEPLTGDTLLACACSRPGCHCRARSSPWSPLQGTVGEAGGGPSARTAHSWRVSRGPATRLGSDVTSSTGVRDMDALSRALAGWRVQRPPRSLAATTVTVPGLRGSWSISESNQNKAIDSCPEQSTAGSSVTTH